MEVPKEVLKAAAGLVEMYGAKFSVLGEKDGRTVYQFDFPEDSYTGYPFVYLFREGDRKAKELTGPEALEAVLFFGLE